MAKQAELYFSIEQLNRMNKAANKNIATLTVQRDKLVSENIDVVSERNRLINERNEIYSELESIKNSLSFKLGRTVTFVPRKIRDIFKRKK